MQSQILKRWSKAPNYMGEDFSDCYVVTFFTRDSNVYEVANFIAVARHLSAIEPESKTGWKIVRFGHWMHGYLYCILVHENSPLVSECEKIVKTLREHGIYDEDVLSECEELILQAIIEDADEDADEDAHMQMLSEVPAAYYCESLLEPYV